MLTSSANQYLRPEYITPLPTTLDAKKSPLALLAQTCSQIGVDPPTSKSLLVPLDKSQKLSKSGSTTSSSSSDSSSRDKSSPSSQSNNSTSSSMSSAFSETKPTSSFKPYESCVSRDKVSSPEQRVPSANSNPGGGGSSSRSRTPAGKRCSSNQSASSGSGSRALTPQGRKSSTPGDSTHRESPSARLAREDAASRSASSYSPSSLQQQHPSSKPTAYSSHLVAYSSAHQDHLVQSTSCFRPSALSLSTSVAGGATTTTTPSAAYGLPFPAQLPPMDPMTASSLMSQHAALKNGLAVNPYLGYTRIKTATGAEALVPVCRDPFCTGCPLNSHLLGAAAAAAATSPVNGSKLPSSTSPSAACPAGCAQCDHKQQQTSAPSPSATAAAASPAPPPSMTASPYAAYAQMVALAAASQLPYICSWVGTDTAYCGKRFASTDELVQHYRSHTGDSAAAAAAATMSLLTPPGHPLLSRSYPTPPLSPLASARYHPYGKGPYPGPPHPHLSALGLSLPPSHPHSAAAAAAAAAAAGLPPYFSPYSLYAAGSRLGAATGMHP
ncbi:zinc finger protein Elbow-like [Copidosoma floridanum]|uniref:zinc finger protein Elbow-like n=1 Tax=Copidosoma floridanum TaxID=29053 RepID=UPI0006C9A772|nr:zinc finger protein Elbow-like [Copidosoma floridanum]